MAVLRAAHLFHAAFKSGDVRFWTGRGDLVAGGHTWTGSADFIGVSEIDAAAGAFASPFTVTLSGLPAEHFDAYARLMVVDASEYRGRAITVSICFFDEAWQVIEEPIACQTGFMDVPILDADAGSRRITLQCEGPFVTRSRPRHGFYTDEDQQLRYPGDKGLEFAPISATRNVKSPVL
ncbi:MAG: hypothetical protein LCH38_10770 [Proteobacteria bacterium]|nr:hypothetical protein [Pseudomonadota bacterium]